MEYRFFRQEQEGYCVPACIQSVLHRRGKEVLAQPEIFKSFKAGEEGVILNASDLGVFLTRYDLATRHIHPKKYGNWQGLVRDILERGVDNLVAYNYHLVAELIGHGLTRQAQHVSLIAGLDEDEKVIVLEPSTGIQKVSLFNLVDATSPGKECGFYLIGTCGDLKDLNLTS